MVTGIGEKPHNKEIPKVTLFGEDYPQTGMLKAYDLEQGSVGDNYLLTVIAALAERGKFIPNMFS
jgi:hypothetical protein